MRLLYQLSIYLYIFGIRCASIFNTKAKQWIKGRRNWKEELKVLEGKKVFWFHCASLGEFEQARPLLENIKEKNKSTAFLVTFFSPSGYEVRKNYKDADLVMYLPSDTVSNANYFIENLDIETAFFIKYEFWFNFLKRLKEKEIPAYLIAGVFHSEQLFFKSYGNWFCEQLKAFKLFFVQEEASAKLINKLNFKNVIVSGDTRYDKVYENAQKAKPVKLVEAFKQEKKILIAGSSWQDEERILTQFINAHKAKGWKYIIAPHQVDKAHIMKIAEGLNQKPLLFSEMNEQSGFDKEVLIIDSIGQLSNMYQYGDIAFIGGAFRGALHNILEAATFSLPVIFGPKHQKFPEAESLIKAAGAFSINDFTTFCKAVMPLVENAELRKATGKKASSFIEERRGATALILEKIQEEIDVQ